MRWTLPNILTILRLLAAPGVAVMFLYFQRPWADWFALVLFVLAAITDFLDGYLARAWKQESRFGAMLDPIADKAMVVIALVIIVGLSTADKLVMDPWILLPATVILFREVFVSGLREYLGAQAHELKVTNLAKYKTTVQMIAISVLFAKGVFEHWLLNMTQGMNATVIDVQQRVEDEHHLRDPLRQIGIALLDFLEHGFAAFRLQRVDDVGRNLVAAHLADGLFACELGCQEAASRRFVEAKRTDMHKAFPLLAACLGKCGRRPVMNKVIGFFTALTEDADTVQDRINVVNERQPVGGRCQALKLDLTLRDVGR